MEFETWWLLGIPIFFALGWIAARVDIRELVSESRTLPTGYFKGLNFLLNDQPDKAIDAFIEIMKLVALRAGQSVPAAGRNRARHPGPPKPACPAGPATRTPGAGPV
jgi:hypothetical protein